MLNRRFTRRISALMALVLLLSTFFSFAAGAQSNEKKFTTMKDATYTAAAHKVDKSVWNDLEKNRYTEILIELNEQADTSDAAETAKVQAGPDASSYDKKMVSRYAVVDALRTTAERTQKPLISTLEQGLENELVKSYESFYIMNVISAVVSKDMVEKLSYFPEVARIKENETVKLELPERTGEEPIQVTEDGIEWNIDRVQAPDAWNEFNVTGQGVVVGVIDTGVQWDHEALKENFRGYDPANPDNPDPSGNWLDRIGSSDLPADTLGHGTHVTGTVMGQDPAGDNIIGVAPDAQWIAARAFSAAGGSQADLLASGEFMLAPDGDAGLAPDIVQNSWGGQPGVSEWYRPMVQAWRDAGMLPVFSAGNSGPGAETVTPPANYPESYAVAATDSSDSVASFSSRGPANYDSDQKPNISSPGVNIRSAVPGNGYEGGWNGTSMASPHISGVAALLLSVDASLTPDDLEDIMDETANPLTDDQYSDVPNDGYGVGMLNAFDSVAMIADGLGTISGQVFKEGTDDTPPSIAHTPVDFGFSGLDINVFANITDDVAVTDAEVIVSHENFENDIAIPMSRTSGDHLEGEYRGVIPYMYVQEPGLEYTIVAEDFGGNVTSTDTYFVDIEFGVKPDEYSEDFENYPIGWVMEGDWEWGEPSTGPEPVVGSNLVGTNLDGNYSANASDVLLFPPFDLRDTDVASLRLNHWYDIEQNWDYGYVGISEDFGESWEIVETFSARDQEWRDLFIDLNPYAGNEDPVFVAFEFTSDSIIHYLGWYVDNVNLFGEDTEAPDVPENLTAESSSAGIALSWDASEAADTAGYNVYRSTTSGTDYELLDNTTNTFYTDSNLESGEEYYYVVTAFDYSENESGYSNEVSAAAPVVEVIFHTDFEEDEGGFTTDGENNSWEWGKPASGPGEAYSGESVWATNLSGSYNNNEDSWIMSPEIELYSELTTAELSFAYWQNIENNWDFGYVEVSDDGGDTWDTLEEYTDVQEQWETDVIPLNSYIGETIHFRFALDTDGSVTRTGWYIDDVAVYGSLDESVEAASVSVIERADRNTEREKVTPQETMEIEIQQNPESYEFEKIVPIGKILDETGLPLDATVTVLETDRTVRTNPIDGSYYIMAAAGETYTLRAESYGYYAAEEEVTVVEDETTVQNFLLDPMPRGDIEGTVTNSRTGEPIADASLQLIDEPQAESVWTDENGIFSFEDVLEGDYTVRVSAEGYNPEEVPVSVTGDETAEMAIELTPFIGYEDEIAYDNGTAENALVLNAAGNGLGVKFTPDETAELRGVSMYVWGSDFPTPGGNEINLVVYDTDANGNPNNRVIDPVPVEVERGAWNYFDLSEYGFVTDGDFFITTLQDEIGDLSPAVGTDEENPNAERSYLYVNGSFQPHFDNGNFMIRANVAYSLDAPVIETPADMSYTSGDSVEVAGTVTADSTVNIYVNGELTASVDSEDKEFSASVNLNEGENTISATAEIEQGETDPSPEITVIKDTVAPELTVTSPEDGSFTNSEAVTVTGSASDENLASVTVNGSEVELDEEGFFSARKLVDEGENTFTVEAVDLAGNTTYEEVTVFVDWTAPVIENIQPAEDITLTAGETLTVSFESDTEGGEASFKVLLPSAMESHNASVAMEETAHGFYEGVWMAPEGNVENLTVEVTLSDAAGNTTTATANGQIELVEISPAVIYDLLDFYLYENEISNKAYRQLTGTLESAEDHFEKGRTSQAVSSLERFKSQVDGNHMRDASDEVKESLKLRADQLIAKWSE